MRTLYILSVWIHVLAAAAWIGTLVFIAAVLVPVLRRQGDDRQRARLLGAAGPGLRTLGWACFGLLFLTGLVNLIGRGFDLADPSDVGWRLWQGPFGTALTWKLLAFAVVLALSALHDFRWGPRAAAAEPGSPEALRLRRIASWVGRANLLLALVIVFFAVLLVRGWP